VSDFRGDFRSDFRSDFLERFRWIGGHADVLALAGEGDLLSRVGRALAEPFAGTGFTHVAAVEARGFVLGTAVALHAGVGFVPVRKAGAVHPGPKLTRLTDTDWRGNRPTLLLQRAALSAGDRVLLVDDWAERGSQALAARSLIEGAGSAYVGLSLLVDQLPADMRARLEPVAAVVAHDELPAPG
jgi:adenine phosphoribosyltransferase